MPLADPRAAADRIVRWFETLTPDSLTGLDDCYTPDATFKDPFNEVKGVDAIRDIFSHMYRALDEPRFIVTGRIVDGEQCFLIWEFRFRFKRFDTTTLQTVRGGSHLMGRGRGAVRKAAAAGVVDALAQRPGAQLNPAKVSPALSP
jgi:steroid delta-isomerase